MRTLHLLRHAKSSWSDPRLPDQGRPLAQRGRRDAKRIPKHLVRLGIEPELVLCSSAERTRETLELVRPGLGATSTVRLEAELYAGSVDRLLKRLRAVPEEVASVLLIGHNPGLQDLALLLASARAELERLEAKFPTAELATLACQRDLEAAVPRRRGACRVCRSEAARLSLTQRCRVRARPSRSAR